MPETLQHVVPVELREAEGQRRLHGCLIQEGRIASQRAELLAPGACQWPAEGVEFSLSIEVDLKHGRCRRDNRMARLSSTRQRRRE